MSEDEKIDEGFLAKLGSLMGEAKALTKGEAATPEALAEKDEKRARLLRLLLIVLVIVGIALGSLWSLHAMIVLIAFLAALLRGG